MNQVVSILILGVLSGICLVALFITLNALFTRLLERTRTIADERAGRAALTGLVNGLFLSALAVALIALGQNSGAEIILVLPFILSLVLLVGIVFGLTAMILVLKERLFPGQLGNRPLAVSASAAILACLTPYLGWFGMLPYLVFRGLGAFILTLAELRRERRDLKAKEAVDTA